MQTYIFDAVVTARKKRFHTHMIEFMNRLYLNSRKYQTNGTVIDEYYKRKFVFHIKEFVSFGTYCQAMFYMSNIPPKDNIDGVCVRKSKLA